MSEGVVTEQPSGRSLPGRWAVGMVNGPCCIGKFRDFLEIWFKLAKRLN